MITRRVGVGGGAGGVCADDGAGWGWRPDIKTAVFPGAGRNELRVRVRCQGAFPGQTGVPAKDLGHPSLLRCGGPVEYRTPEERPSLEEARAWCKRLTGSHYENFHVATFFLPKAVRPHFESIYAYCRVADDLGDEVGDVRLAKELLTAWGEMLNECYDAPEKSRHPVFVALRETIVACDVAAADVSGSCAGVSDGSGEDGVRVDGRVGGILAVLGEPGGAAGVDGVRVSGGAAGAAVG